MSEGQGEVGFGFSEPQYGGVFVTCCPPAEEARISIDLDTEHVPVVGSVFVQGKGLYVNVTSGGETLFELPNLTQSEFGASLALVVAVPIDHKLFNELARTGALQVKGDGERALGAKAVSVSYRAAKGKEYARAFVRRCKRSR